MGQRARRGLYLAGIDRMGVPAPWVPGARAGGPGDRRGYDEGRPRYYSRILLVCLTILIKSNTPRSLQPELSNCPIPVTRWICHITRNIPRNTGYRVHRLGRPAAYVTVPARSRSKRHACHHRSPRLRRRPPNPSSGFEPRCSLHAKIPSPAPFCQSKLGLANL